jgi:catechol 2,3-dioxygenase-like lactoylglutathione lyase family enzyme
MSSLPADYKPPAAPQLPAGPSGANAEATKTYGLSHTMIRIKDPKQSLDFYIQQLGMTLVHVMHSEGGKFTNYFLFVNLPALDRRSLSSMFKNLESLHFVTVDFFAQAVPTIAGT